MLSRARVVHGDSSFANDVSAIVTNAVCMIPWQRTFIDEVKTMRDRLEASRNPGDLKRGSGGMADVEFLIELCKFALVQAILPSDSLMSGLHLKQ